MIDSFWIAATGSGGSGGLSQLLLPLLVLIVVAVIGMLIIQIVRRMARGGANASAPGFTLQDLRDLHQRGTLTDEEFERAKANLLRSVTRDEGSGESDDSDRH